MGTFTHLNTVSIRTHLAGLHAAQLSLLGKARQSESMSVVYTIHMIPLLCYTFPLVVSTVHCKQYSQNLNNASVRYISTHLTFK